MIGKISARVGNSRRGSIGRLPVGKAERSRLACGITVCGADDRFELGAAGGATSAGGSSGFAARLELGPAGGAASIGDATGFGARVELGAEGVVQLLPWRAGTTLLVPILGGGEVIGLLQLADPLAGSFGDDILQPTQLLAQFAAATGEDIPLSRLPAAAQDALRQFSGNGGPARILYSHATSRKDTGWVSDQRATKILAMEASANGRNDIVALIKMAMRMFDLKSDACDNSLDSRCDQPGVREAFAQIKREEALQRTAARF